VGSALGSEWETGHVLNTRELVVFWTAGGGTRVSTLLRPECGRTHPESNGFLACPTVSVLRDVVEDCAHSRFAHTRCS
jgi:hypothetical protein